MAPPFGPKPPPKRWSTPFGHSVIQKIVKKHVPHWPNGLRDWQVPVVARTLDSIHSMNVTATGDGKSGMYYIPILIHLALAKDPSLWPGMACKKYAVGIVVLPINAIATTMVG